MYIRSHTFQELQCIMYVYIYICCYKYMYMPIRTRLYILSRWQKNVHISDHHLPPQVARASLSKATRKNDVTSGVLPQPWIRRWWRLNITIGPMGCLWDWYIYLHYVKLYGKCRVNIPVSWMLYHLILLKGLLSWTLMIDSCKVVTRL